MSELASVSKGEVDLKVVVEKGVVKLEVKYDGAGANAGMYVELEADYFLDKLAAAIPGQIDDSVIGLIKAALKA